MGPNARVLWDSFPELCHVWAVLVIAALMAAVMGNALYGDRAASLSSLTGSLSVLSCADTKPVQLAQIAAGCLHLWQNVMFSLCLYSHFADAWSAVTPGGRHLACEVFASCMLVNCATAITICP